jgi:ABC-2 type transport system permease protein
MSPRRFWAVARKEFIHIVRDFRSLGLAIAIPMFMLLLFGYALTLDVDQVPFLVWDPDHSPSSRALISAFSGSRYFDFRGGIDGYADAERAIDERRVLMALIIPSDFSARVESGRPAEVQVILDGSDANTATIALGYAEAVTQTASGRIAQAALRRAGVTLRLPELEMSPRVWFNEDMESRNFIIPGLIAVILSILAALLTSLTVAREWETGTMEQLISTPVKRAELILGKLLPYFVIGMLDVVLAVLMGKFLFQVPIRGSVALIFAAAAVFLAGALGVGTLISVVTRSQLLSSQLAMMITYLPAIMLSGFVFAIRNMPLPLQWLTYIFPARYFVSILKGIFLKGLNVEFLAAELALLGLFAMAVIVLSMARFRKKLG